MVKDRDWNDEYCSKCAKSFDVCDCPVTLAAKVDASLVKMEQDILRNLCVGEMATFRTRLNDLMAKTRLEVMETIEKWQNQIRQTTTQSKS